MPNYRRAWQPGGTWFFTVTLQHRSDNDLLVRHIDALRAAVRAVAAAHPFMIDGWVVLPEHLHCILTLPLDDTDFAMRWRLIKGRFARSLPEAGNPSAVELRRGERGIWQRRYWEHLIRDEADFRRHMDYVHFNPVKHGLVTRWRLAVFDVSSAGGRRRLCGGLGWRCRGARVGASGLSGGRRGGALRLRLMRPTGRGRDRRAG